MSNLGDIVDKLVAGSMTCLKFRENYFLVGTVQEREEGYLTLRVQSSNHIKFKPGNDYRLDIGDKKIRGLKLKEIDFLKGPPPRRQSVQVYERRKLGEVDSYDNSGLLFHSDREFREEERAKELKEEELRRKRENDSGWERDEKEY